MDDVQAPALELTAQHLELAAVDGALMEDRVAASVREACSLGLRAVIVRPSDLDQAARMMYGDTKLASVCGYPDGASTTSVKVFEARDALRRGAREIHAVLNLGKLNSRQFQYVEMELIQLAQNCHEAGAKLRAIFQTPLLTEEGRLVASKISKRSEVDSVIPCLAQAPADHMDLLLRKCPPLVEVCGYATDLDTVLAALAGGCSGASVPNPTEILEQWKQRQTPARPS